jgi:hypothetical protein
MKIRDAVEADVPALAALADVPPTALRNLVHQRSVRMLVESGDDGEWADDAGDATAEGVEGFLSFDVRDGTVHVTQFGGDAAAGERLLAEPLRFARSEALPVEALVREGDDALRAALEATGFERVGDGPTFRGAPTDRYRFERAD